MKSLKEIASKSVLSEKQLADIEKIILDQGPYTPDAVREELGWFCAGLGMPEYYFRTTPLEIIANHIRAIKAAEIIATVGREKTVKIDLATELENEAIYLVDDFHSRALEVERRIEKKYPNCRLQSYRTLRKAGGLDHLRMYIVSRPQFAVEGELPGETDIRRVADKTFLATTIKETRDRYQRYISKTIGWESPHIDVTRVERTDEIRIFVITNRESHSRFFSNVSDVINSHGLVSNRKYVEQFANGKTAYAFYLDDIKDENLIRDIIEDISLIYVIPKSSLSSLFGEGQLSAQETVFGVSAWSFARQFLTGFNEEYLRLSRALEDSPELLGILREMKTKLVKDTYTEQRVWDALANHPLYTKKLFALFDKKFNPSSKDRDIRQEMESLKREIVKNIQVKIDRDIFQAVIVFIDSILRTNFYMKEKTSLAYMYNPAFLNKVDYPETPFGVFHIIGSEMRGFHIRFRDIARGGIRIVRSTSIQNYLNNSDFIFDENYNLAHTQQRKNKDLPEGGSKGTILLHWDSLDRGPAAFKKYIDGLLDLMLAKESVVDFHNKPVLLFLGPDEGTADFMEWAALRAKTRGYSYWRGFSTGKPLSMGGIPHDLYGMTTNSVHEYVVKSLEKLGLKEEKITKVMTGGPDGDLGSNEIFISKDRILAIIDGSGVLHDPQGIDRKELRRLAKARKMVEHFNTSLLSPRGYLVRLQDRDITLPDGEVVESGLDFRNSFHLHPKFKADIFVPCGGRPASVNISNWQQYLNEQGEPRFKLIVEGANLFITQQARLRLEEKRVIIYKDASANKGGVTSSSLEVLAGLALSEKEYEELMCVKNGKESKFRQKYVQAILEVIRENARLEFEVIWREHESGKIPRSVLSDMISEKINQLKDAVNLSDLAADQKLFRKVIERWTPAVLLEHIGFTNFVKRVPETYLKALFASHLAGRYVYTFGLDANEINFYEFLKGIR